MVEREARGSVCSNPVRKRKKGTLATPLGEQAPKNTPEASRGTDSTISIPDSGEKSNPSAKKTSSNRRDALPDTAESVGKERPRYEVSYEGEVFPVYLNVGRAKNDGTYHIYDVTQKIRDTANRINGFERPKPNEGYAQENDVSTHSIPDSGEKSNLSDEISNLHGLESSINKKESSSQYLADLKKSARRTSNTATRTRLWLADSTTLM